MSTQRHRTAEVLDTLASGVTYATIDQAAVDAYDALSSAGYHDLAVQFEADFPSADEVRYALRSAIDILLAGRPD